MNIFQRYTLEVLKKNKTRTAVTIIGVALSTALIISIATLLTSTQNFLVDYISGLSGDWHGKVAYVSAEDVKSISKDERIDKGGLYQKIGYAKVKSLNEEMHYIFVTGFDENLMNMLPIHLISGRMPENAEEIVVPEHLIADKGLDIKVGNNITLDIGRRYFGGEEQDDKNGYSKGEEWSHQYTKNYRVVGISQKLPTEDERYSSWYVALTGLDNTLIDNSTYDYYVKLKSPSMIYKFLNDVLIKYEYGSSTNDDYLNALGVSDNHIYQIILYSIGLILIIFVGIGAIALIHNAFSISINERMKQFGILSSVGATKKQLKKSVQFEAADISMIGIPLGVGIGILSMAFILKYIGGTISDLFSTNADFTMVISPIAIIVSCIIAVITVRISASIPTRKISKVSAIDAIRQSREITVEAKQIKVPKIISAVFGLEGIIAAKNFRRNKRRYRSTIVSLAMSIILFIGAASIAMYINAVISRFMPLPQGDIYGFTDNISTVQGDNNIYKQLTSVDGVDKGTYNINFDIDIGIKKEKVDQLLFRNAQNEQETIDNEYLYTPTQVHFIPDEQFNELVQSLNIENVNFYDVYNLRAIAYDSVSYYDTADDKTKNTPIFSEHKPTEIELKPYKHKDGKYVADEESPFMKDKLLVEVAAFSDELPLSTDRGIKGTGDFLNIFLPESLYYQVFAKYHPDVTVVMGFLTEKHEAVYDKMSNVIKDLSEEIVLQDLYKKFSVNYALLDMFDLLAYVFIIIFAGISVSNVFNTISTNIGLRSREIAMLKSIGMTQKGIHKMMSYECLLYGIKSLSVGIPIALLINCIIYFTIARRYDIAYIFPYGSLLIAIFSVFAVVFITMMYAVKKLNRNNMMDTLRSEIL